MSVRTGVVLLCVLSAVRVFAQEPIERAPRSNERDAGFARGRFDPSRPPKLDGTIVWNTFLGGEGHDLSVGNIAVDWSGNVYVSGYSFAAWGSPVRAYTPGPLVDGRVVDAFAAKLDPNGTLLWITFLGGTGGDYGNGIAVDQSGNVYVCGTSSATWGSPVRAYAADRDAFAAKLDPNGRLLWNTFLGGPALDSASAIAVDASGNVYIGGDSDDRQFLPDPKWGSPVRTFTAGSDAFAAKLDTNGILLWNTFLGGTGLELGWSIAVDRSGNVYMCGYSAPYLNVYPYSDPSWGWPVRSFTREGYSDAFAAKLDMNGILLWNTFLGGTGSDIATGIAVDGSGSVYVTGDSDARWGIIRRRFLSSVRAYTAGDDGFVAKLDQNGTLVWNTFLGGTGYDQAWSIAVDGSNNVYVGGLYSDATWGSPVRAYTEGHDVFAAKLDANGTLVWNTFLGGAGTDMSGSIAVDTSGNVYMSGYSENTWGTPVRPHNALLDAFVVKLDSGLPDRPSPGASEH